MVSDDPGNQNQRLVLPDGQNVIGIILALTAILTVGGYTVTQVHLNRYTGITSYSVVSAQFLAAGLSLVVSFVFALTLVLILGVVFEVFAHDTKFGNSINKFIHSGWLSFYKTETIFSSRFFAKLTYFVALVLCLVSIPAAFVMSLASKSLILAPIQVTGFMGMASVLPIIFFTLLSESPSSQARNWAAGIRPNRRQDNLVTIFASLLVGFIFLLYAIALGWFFGSSAYSLIPRWLGGGQPTPVSVAFRSAESAGSLGLLPNQQAQVEHVCLLAELAEGLLIYDPAQQRTMVVQTGSDSEVLGYYDDHTPVDCSPPLSRRSSARSVSEQFEQTSEATAEATLETTQEATVEATP